MKVCHNCPAYPNPYLGGKGAVAPGGVMVVLGAPDKAQVGTHSAFGGDRGKRLVELLNLAGYSPDACWVTFAQKCVPKGKQATKPAITRCAPFLQGERWAFKPQTIITVGPHALDAVAPHLAGRKNFLRDYHSLPVELNGTRLIPLYEIKDEDSAARRAEMRDQAREIQNRPKLTRILGEYGNTVPPMLSGTYALDTETTGLTRDDRLLGVSISWKHGEAAYGEPGFALAYLERNRGLQVWMWNAKFDLQVLWREGWPEDLFAQVDDGMVLAYCMNLSPLGLKTRVLRDLGLVMPTYDETSDGGSLEDVPLEQVTHYACSDADGTLRETLELIARATPRERRLYTRYDRPIIPILAKMEHLGVRIDRNHYEHCVDLLGDRIDTLDEQFQREWGVTPETLSSPAQLSEYLYKTLGLRTTIKTDKGRISTGKDALDELKGQHPSIDLLLDRRRYVRRRDTITGILEHDDGTDHIHPQYNQTLTATGRFSGSEPNPQNWEAVDIKVPGSEMVKGGIVAPEGFKIVEADYSQIELRALAYISQDPHLLDSFARGVDAHAETARAILGHYDDHVRRLAKVANFLTIFGGGAGLLARRTGTTLGEAKEFLEKYFQLHPAITQWIKQVHWDTAKNGFAESIFGRRRYTPGMAEGGDEVWKAKRQAQNMPPQATAADVIKMALRDAAKICVPFNQVHDSLDFYVREEDLNETIPEIVRAMEGVDCPFKLVVDVKVGPNLAEMEDWSGK